MSDMAASFSIVERLFGLVEENQLSNDSKCDRIPFISEVDQRLVNTTLSLEPKLESAIATLRNSWCRLSESQRSEFEQFAQQIYSLNNQLQGLASLKFRLSFLPASIYCRRDIYGLANKFALRIAKAILETSKAWQELKEELDEMSSVPHQEFDLDEPYDELEALLSKSTGAKEVLDWGKPQGAEIW